MKILRFLTMAVLILGISSAAHAFQFSVLDPAESDGPFFVIQPGQPFSFSFAPCNVFLEGQWWEGCAVGFNDSNKTITNINFGFDNSLDGQSIQCSSDAFSDINCGLTSDSSEYALTFEDGCGSNSCGIDPYHFVVLLEDGVSASDFPDVDGAANTPEPSSIWMALSGIGSLGYFVRRRRRAASLA